MDINEIEDSIGRLEHLSTLPVILSRILEVTCEPSSSPQDLYRIISHDQALAERIVRVANSSFFGHSGMVGDIRQAIMLLGYEHIRNISLSMSVCSISSKKGDLNLRNFWAHCYEVAFISAFIAEIATMVNPRNAFLAGLLHDTGRLLFYSLNHDRYKAIICTDDLTEKEVELFGCDHAFAGALFAEKARLPEEQVLAIRYHHAPALASEFRDITAVVSLSEALSRRFSPKIEDDGIWTGEHDAILLELSLFDEDIKEIGDRLKAEEAEIRGLLELI